MKNLSTPRTAIAIQGNMDSLCMNHHFDHVLQEQVVFSTVYVSLLGGARR